jgi:AraC-like DNA-binding protein
MDPLSDILSLLKPVNYMSAGFDGGGDWAIDFPDQTDTIKCASIVQGGCWLTVQGVDTPLRLETGDCFILPRGQTFHLASNLEADPATAQDVFGGAQYGGIVTWNGGGDVFIVSSRFSVSQKRFGMLLSLLPFIVHIRREANQGELRWLVERMMRELQTPSPGSLLSLQHLAHMILLQALRRHLGHADSGLLKALADEKLNVAITAMHQNPAFNWTVQELADLTGMSRTVFAQKFKDAVGTAPIDYLIRWRMLLASDRLIRASEPISTIAYSLGYDSEGAFSTAFKRVMGHSPRQYGLAHA